MKATYFGDTLTNIQQTTFSKMVSGWIHPSFRFQHGGTIELQKEKLILENWVEIDLKIIESISCTFDKNFSRFTANNDSRLGLFTRGEPLIIKTQKESYYLMIDWSYFTGFTTNRQWAKDIEEHLNRFYL